jgi:cellulose synthase/poly-beta-1,6-N-acetylglucosamine synthase-like glycosyltransferase
MTRGLLCLATLSLLFLSHAALAQVSTAAAATKEPASVEAPAGRLSVDLRDVNQWASSDQVSSALTPPPASPLEIAPAPEIEARSALMWKRSWFAPSSITVQWLGSPISAIPNSVITAAEVVLLLVLFLIVTYTVRHFFFTLNRLFGEQRHPYLDIDTAEWPSVTVLIPAHNEEAVIGNSMTALLQVDYPADRLTIMPVNDRSTDGTRKLIDDLALANPNLIDPYHRTDGAPGKAAALKDASDRVASDIIIVFDADYLPGRGLIKQLVAPFFDPQTGAVMGRVVPVNTGKNLLTRLLDMERAGGYQVDQQARMNLNLVPQYGGTVGGVRRTALDDVGGWDDDVLAEDTDLTYRLLLRGWKTVYQNRSECYEEVPETWPVRVRQIMRWAKGHNQVACRYVLSLIGSSSVSWAERLDGFLLLGVYLMAPMLLVGWLMTVFLFYFSSAEWLAGSLALIALMSYAAVGNFAAFFEIAAAAYLDGSTRRMRLLPLNFFGFLVSLLSVSRATFNQIIFDGVCQRSLVWDKTVRYSKPAIAKVPDGAFTREGSTT